MTVTFLLTSLVICVSPGTGALFSIAAGLSRGARAGLLAAFACTLGVVPHMVAALTGLAALLHASGVAFAVVKYLGVAYLAWMAWATWRDTGALQVEHEQQPRSVRQVLVSGITVNLLNPKLTVFFFAFLVYAQVAAAMREQVLARPHLLVRLRRAFAACFLALSGRLALEAR